MLKTPRELMKGWEEILGRFLGGFFSKKKFGDVSSWMIQSMFFFLFGLVTSREKNNTSHEQPSFAGLPMTCWRVSKVMLGRDPGHKYFG